MAAWLNLVMLKHLYFPLDKHMVINSYLLTLDNLRFLLDLLSELMEGLTTA